MPYKLQYYTQDWIEFDSALSLVEACRLASYWLRRRKDLNENLMRIVLDGAVVV